MCPRGRLRAGRQDQGMAASPRLAPPLTAARVAFYPGSKRARKKVGQLPRDERTSREEGFGVGAPAASRTTESRRKGRWRRRCCAPPLAPSAPSAPRCEVISARAWLHPPRRAPPGHTTAPSPARPYPAHPIPAGVARRRSASGRPAGWRDGINSPMPPVGPGPSWRRLRGVLQPWPRWLWPALAPDEPGHDEDYRGPARGDGSA